MADASSTTTSKSINRYKGWVALVAFSAIALGSFVDDGRFSVKFKTVIFVLRKLTCFIYDNFLFDTLVGKDRSPKEKYVIACCSLSLSQSFFIVISLLFFENFMNGKPYIEGIVGVELLALWSAAIAIIQNPKNLLATVANISTKSENIKNANLYFFSWASFLSVVFVCASLAQQVKLFDVRTIPQKLLSWYLLLVSSVVVLGTSSNVVKDACAINDELLCNRTRYATSIGVIVAFLSLLQISMSHIGKHSKWMEMSFSVIALVLFSVGVGYITAADGPGSTIGNLFFSTWISFILSVTLAFSTFKDFTLTEPPATSSGHESVEAEGTRSKTASKPVEVTAEQVQTRDVVETEP